MGYHTYSSQRHRSSPGGVRRGGVYMKHPGGFWDGGNRLYWSWGRGGDENSSIMWTGGGAVSRVEKRTHDKHCLRSHRSAHV